MNGTTTTHDTGVLIVGASLAGLRVAEALRKHGYDGRLVLIGEEEHLPYDRPPLSKQLLAGDWEAGRLALTSTERLYDAKIEIQLGTSAVGARPGSVELADGSIFAYSQLVVATGASARTWPGAAPEGRVHRLRTLGDSQRLRTVLAAGDDLVIVGGGFIGLEVAAAARRAGVDVTMVEQANSPLEPILGPEVGGCFARLHVAHGVRLLAGQAITAIDEGAEGVTVRLADGSELSARRAVVGIGAVPNNGWLSGLGLDRPGGVPCDSRGRALADVWALGDVAAWEEPVFGDQTRHEHWTRAIDQASVVAADMLGLEPTHPHELPYFWSMQYDVNFQLVGRPDLATSVSVLEPGLDGHDRGTLFGFRRADRLVAVAAFHNPPRFLKLRRQLQQQLTATLTST